MALAEWLPRDLLGVQTAALPCVDHPGLARLLDIWLARRGDRPLPEHGDLSLGDLQPWISNISVNEVEPSKERIRIRLVGRRLIEYHGANHQGRYLEEVAPALACKRVMEPQLESVRQRVPTYDVQPLLRQPGTDLQLHRLVLPFATDGETVDIIMVASYVEDSVGTEAVKLDRRLFDLLAETLAA